MGLPPGVITSHVTELGEWDFCLGKGDKFCPLHQQENEILIFPNEIQKERECQGIWRN